jgi:hypothetical protein
VGLVYEVSQESIVTDDTLMCKWRMGTENIVARGGLFDVAKQGMLLASFTNDDKLRSVEVSFDVMAFMQQLRRAANRAIFQVRFSSTRIICESWCFPCLASADVLRLLLRCISYDRWFRT